MAYDINEHLTERGGNFRKVRIRNEKLRGKRSDRDAQQKSARSNIFLFRAERLKKI